MKHWIVVLNLFMVADVVFAESLSEKAKAGGSLSISSDGNIYDDSKIKKGVFRIVSYSDYSKLGIWPEKVVENQREKTEESRQNGYVIVGGDLVDKSFEESLNDNNSLAINRTEIINKLNFQVKNFDLFREADVIELMIKPAGSVSATGSTGIIRGVSHSKLGNLTIYENDYVKSGQDIIFAKEAINFHAGGDPNKPGILTRFRNDNGRTLTKLNWISGDKIITINRHSDIDSGLSEKEETKELHKLAEWLDR